MRETEEDRGNEYATHIENYKNELKKKYSIRSRIGEWLNDRVQIEAVKRIFILP